MRKNFLVFGAPNIQQDDIDNLVSVMHSGWLGTGPKVAEFEAAFARYKNSPATHVAALNSCTAALHTSLIALDLQPGDEVITTALTFCATVNAIIHAGAIPVLADVAADTMNIDPEDVEKRITTRTKAIIPVHFAGRPCQMDRLMEIANQHNLRVIEDCAHAIETQYHDKNAGTFGDFGCFSFYVTKNVVTGEGGMVVARTEEDIERIKVLSLHGMSKDAWQRYGDAGYKHYKVVDCGFKYNMMDLQAAIGVQQLARVEENWQLRASIWNQYQSAFTDLPVTTPSQPEPHTRHAYHLYNILIDPKQCGITRDDFLGAMTERNIGVGVHYLSLADHPYYQKSFGWKAEHYPCAASIGAQTVSLPLSAGLSDTDINDVIDTVCEVIHNVQ